MSFSRQQVVALYIDLTRMLDRALQGRWPTGVDRVDLEYVRHFRQQARALVRFAGRWMFFAESDSRSLFDWLLAPDVQQANRIRWLVGGAYAVKWRPPEPGSILLNTGHGGLDRPDYIDRVQCYRLRPVYFLHDLIPIAFPEYGRPRGDERHRSRIMTMLASARGLIVNSAATGSAVELHALQAGVATPPWVAAHLAPPDFSSPSPVRPLAYPYFVVLGTVEPRKNHLLLLNLWRQMVGLLGHKAPRLVIIGQRGWECEQVVDMLERCTVLPGFVIEVSECNDATLVTWLHHAQALLFPSFAEGYGIPLVEALSLGTPVIVSELPVFREIASDIPEYLNPIDGLGWMQAILEYSTAESPRRAAQLVRMAGWKAPTWEAHFALIDEFIERCCQ